MVGAVRLHRIRPDNGAVVHGVKTAVRLAAIGWHVDARIIDTICGSRSAVFRKGPAARTRRSQRMV